MDGVQCSSFQLRDKFLTLGGTTDKGRYLQTLTVKDRQL